MIKIQLTDDQVRSLAKQFGTPFYVYDENALRSRAKLLTSAPSAYGHKSRYAMKACPSAAVIKIFSDEGLGIDASSGYEVDRALKIGIKPENISLTAQELSKNIAEHLEIGVDVNASSIEQLKIIAPLARDLKKSIGIRFNPGLGSGHSNRTNVGGPSSGFGIWKQYVHQVKEIADSYSVHIHRIHSHIGAGVDPTVWRECTKLTLGIVKYFPEATSVCMGGGFKTARMPTEKETDLHQVIGVMAEEFQNFAQETGRKLKLELEPGTFLMANCGVIISTIIDQCDTGSEGYEFLKLDTGMTEIIRPSMYASQHPLSIISQDPKINLSQKPTKKFLVIGHCCESGDILTPALDSPEGLLPRELPEPTIGDLMVIHGAGAYTAGMSTINYNSFPCAAEVLIQSDGNFRLIRKRQTLEQIMENEIY
jgi:diaminopimelate decarboxylase